MDRMEITKAQLRGAIAAWEQEHRDGKTRTHDETLALPVEQVAAESADYLWDQLQLAVPA